MFYGNKLLNFLSSIRELSKFEYKALHRKKFFGVIWKFLNPLFMMTIYSIVFSYLYSGGNRGFVITIGILIFSGISSTLNSSTNWLQPKILNFSESKRSLSIYFFSKIYYNFVPIFYLLPVMVVVQQVIFNSGFQFTLIESFTIYLKFILFIPALIIYCYFLTIPLSIMSKKIPDLKELIPHFLRVVLYMSPILWVAKTNNIILDTIIQGLNPFYFIFEITNWIIYRYYDISQISFILPIILLSFNYLYYFKKNKFVINIREVSYLG